jgi:tetratricopeptide (TPR) repeat protein
MNCQKCGYSGVPDGARFCPECGQPIAGAAQPGAQVTVMQDVGSVAGGEVSGVDVGQVTGDVTVESTVNQIEATVVRGDYVDRDVITNNILVLGDPHALDEILRRLMAMQGVEGQPLQSLDALAVPEHVGDGLSAVRQIAEVMAAQKEVAARGLPATPQALYSLGRLAVYRRDYDAALDYFRQAAQADPEYGDAFKAIVWLQQSRAMHDVQTRDYDAAIGRLADARTASLHTDPLDREALALRGYVAKTLAQVAEARGDLEDRRRYYQEAARFFEHVVQLELGDAAAHNGLGNVAYALGDLDTAIAAYRRAVKLAPGYTAAHHDLALVFEAKMQADPAHADEWCQRALQAWQRAYELAPDDPGFSADAVLAIGQRISRLRRECGQAGP